MSEENLKQEVLDALEGAEGTSDSTPSEEVPSGDVKPAEAKVEEKAAEPNPTESKPARDVSKLEEQLSNLNKALQVEREEAKKLKDKLNSFDEPLTKLKGIFSPQEQAKEEPKFLTQDELDAYYEQKEEERTKEDEKKKYREELEKQINKLEKEWDGTEGKPKYEDQETIEWQRDNSKLHLSPEEAFFAMRKQELIDYEVKKKLSGAPEVREVGRPGATESEIKEEIKELDDSEMLNAVREAIESEMTTDI